VFVAHTAQRRGLPAFTADAVAARIEDSHREAEDRTRQSAVFARTETLVIEAAQHARARGARRVERRDVQQAIAARNRRHDGPDERLRAANAEGDRVVHLSGARIGQLNGLSVIDLGDYRFGLPMRVAARTVPGTEGLLNIEREVGFSGPIHDKAVLILHSYLSALLAPLAPLALSASIVFEQEYAGVEGDSASCAEFFALLSALSGVPLRQSIAVTGAINPFGEVLPIGGVNEKIEGFFRVCAAHGLDGSHGVIIPARNRRHLVLDDDVCVAVERGLFHVWAIDHVAEGMTLLTGVPFGLDDPRAATAPLAPDGQPTYAPGSVLARAAETLRAYRRACLRAGNPRAWRGRG
jgi:predicted ATP-dependent protease